MVVRDDPEGSLRYLTAECTAFSKICDAPVFRSVIDVRCSVMFVHRSLSRARDLVLDCSFNLVLDLVFGIFTAF